MAIKTKIKLSIFIFTIVTIGLLAIISSSKLSYSNSQLDDVEVNNALVFKPVIEKLIQRGVDKEFIDLMINHENTSFNQKYVKINVIPSTKSVDYSHFYSDESTERSRSFLIENLELLDSCEKRFNVDKEVITSILWIETRFGNYLGNSHVVSVYLSTALANETQYIKSNTASLKANFTGNDDELDKLEKKLIERSKKKSDWALDQLIALSKIHSDKINIMDIYGSWAGAFGISQFIPTSYKNWAIDGNSDGMINLFDLPDAVYSTANYLKENGWGETDEARKKAVFHYNNSSAYVNAVLELAGRIEFNDIRTPLSAQMKLMSFFGEIGKE